MIIDGWNIQQSKNPRRLIIAFSYNKKWVDLVKTIPDRRWSNATKTWSIPSRESKKVLQALKYHKIPYKVDPKIEIAAKELSEFEDRLTDIKLDKFEPLPEIPHLLATLKDYQEPAVRYMATAGSAILADGMSLGKTLTSLAAVLLLEASPVLILCDATLKWHWERQIKLHTDTDCVIIHGNKKKRKEQWDKDVRFYIASYAIVLYDKDDIDNKNFQCVIADEASAHLKNQGAQTTKSVKSITTKYRMPLTGTPIENRLEELHSLLDWCQPGILGSLFFFKERYAKKDFFGRVIGWKLEGIKEIRQTIAPYIMRRTKRDEYRGHPILDRLPPKLPTQNIMVEFNQAEKRAYRLLSKEILELIKLQMMSPLTRVLRCKQFTTLPRMVDFDSEGPKMRELEHILEEGKGESKFLIFSEFIDAVELISSKFSLPFMIGETKQEDRQVLIDEFNNSDQLGLVCSNVASYGVEITGADVVVHVDTPWNPAKMEQREDRAHRTGQQRAVKVLRLMVLDSVDDRIDKIISGKIDLRNEILEDLDYDNIIKTAGFSKKDWETILFVDEDND